MPDKRNSPLIDQFLDAVWLESGLSANTLAAYRTDLKKISDWLEKRKQSLDNATKAELFEMGQQGGLSCFPVNTVEDVYATEQYRFRGFFQEVEHPVAGTYAYPGIPFHFSSHQPGIRSRAPLLGEHTLEILAELGVADADITKLKSDGII